MPNSDKLKSNDRKKKIVKFLKKFAILVFILLLFVIILCLPDLILSFRKFLSEKLPIPLLTFSETDGLSIDNYVLIVLSTCECLVAASLAWITYCLSKQLGKIELGTQSAHKMFWAGRVADAVKHNLSSVYKASVISIAPTDLIIYPSFDEDVINLFTAECITKSERNRLEQCMMSFRYIDGHSGSEAIDKMNAIISEYIVEDSGQFIPQINELLDKLDSIRWEGNKDE